MTTHIFRPFSDSLTIKIPVFTLLFMAMLVACFMTNDITPLQRIIFISIGFVGPLFALTHLWINRSFSISIQSDGIHLEGHRNASLIMFEEIKRVEFDEKRVRLRFETLATHYVVPLNCYLQHDRISMRDQLSSCEALKSSDVNVIPVGTTRLYKLVLCLILFLFIALMSPLFSYLFPLTWINKRLIYPNSASVYYVAFILVAAMTYIISQHKVSPRSFKVN
ncbi:hypothetical protein Pla110_15930 [Polystyrenella longa]|uniref:Uncharacterized protein n=1 Tax=Polystyrenella longa TaxID=2528007 RepID=A0A518CKX6_9PLAN|nr:hypothetical protein Pla110_15930 [Polystyrenella longa]